MSLAVVLTEDALRDLDDLHAFVTAQDGLARADHLLDGIHEKLAALSGFPQCGEYPPERLTLGIKQFRQIHYKPWRMICQVSETTVAVLLIADVRRDMQSLLQRRLLD